MPDQHKKALATLSIDPRPIVGDISVVIPTLGRPILEECLYWIIAGSAWPEGLIVVDQGSDPQIADWVAALRSLGIHGGHVLSSQRGRAGGLNRGLERVETRLVAITDDDCFVDTDWLKYDSPPARRA